MGMSQSRRCYQCKSIVGWNANLCSHCEYRQGNEELHSRDDHSEPKFSLWRMWLGKRQPEATGQDNRSC